MTTHDSSHASHVNVSWGALLMNSIRRQFAALSHRARVRRDIKTLMEFDDRMLADIGLHRADVSHVVRYGRLPRRGNDRIA